MRFWIVLALAACSTTDHSGGGHNTGLPELCPGGLVEGDTCFFLDRCWNENTFSSCESGWCDCVDGHFRCQALAPIDGELCGDEPIEQCSYEGTPSCDIPPTAQWCGCDGGGTWRCECLCYGGQSTCPVDPCTLSPQKINGALCGDHGQVCTYPGNASCTCEQAIDGAWKFACR